jgi:hypothetical protein
MDDTIEDAKNKKKDSHASLSAAAVKKLGIRPYTSATPHDSQQSRANTDSQLHNNATHESRINIISAMQKKTFSPARLF